MPNSGVRRRCSPNLTEDTDAASKRAEQSFHKLEAHPQRWAESDLRRPPDSIHAFAQVQRVDAGQLSGLHCSKELADLIPTGFRGLGDDGRVFQSDHFTHGRQPIGDWDL